MRFQYRDALELLFPEPEPCPGHEWNLQTSLYMFYRGQYWTCTNCREIRYHSP